jgi:hypothetical protein
MTAIAFERRRRRGLVVDGARGAARGRAVRRASIARVGRGFVARARRDASMSGVGE